MNALPYPEWQLPVQDAILETDRRKFPQKVRKAQLKIFERCQQVRQSIGTHHERDAMTHSLALLQGLRDERLTG
jgi:hypothetical protein